MNERYNIIGQKFNLLTVIERSKNDKNGNAMWLCKCDCGKFKEISGIKLRANRVKSCGCLLIESRKRKINKNIDNKFYWKLSRIKSRCYNPNNPRYSDYGGRGIKVCEEWLNDFMSFYNWAMENGYEEGLTIDRIDVNGNYEPSNCRWVTLKEQSNNKRNNIIIKYNNKKMTLKQWSELNNLNYKMVFFYYKKGIKLEDIAQTIKKNRINKRITMCNSKTKEKIKEFSCVNEAIINLKLNKNQRSSIYACLNGRQNTGLGYIWRYVDE